MKLYLGELPLTPGAALFTVSIKGREFRFRLAYANTAEAGWFVDIGDGESNALVCGLPLLPGMNILGQFAYLGLGFGLLVSVTGKGDLPPTFEDMGAGMHLYVATVQ